MKGSSNELLNSAEAVSPQQWTVYNPLCVGIDCAMDEIVHDASANVYNNVDDYIEYILYTCDVDSLTWGLPSFYLLVTV